MDFIATKEPTRPARQHKKTHRYISEDDEPTGSTKPARGSVGRVRGKNLPGKPEKKAAGSKKKSTQAHNLTWMSSRPRSLSQQVHELGGGYAGARHDDDIAEIYQTFSDPGRRLEVLNKKLEAVKISGRHRTQNQASNKEAVSAYERAIKKETKAADVGRKGPNRHSPKTPDSSRSQATLVGMAERPNYPAHMKRPRAGLFSTPRTGHDSATPLPNRSAAVTERPNYPVHMKRPRAELFSTPRTGHESATPLPNRSAAVPGSDGGRYIPFHGRLADPDESDTDSVTPEELRQVVSRCF